MQSPHTYWKSGSTLGVRGTGFALPGEPVPTEELVAHLERRFNFSHGREARRIAHKLGIEQRHIVRDFADRHEQAREGNSNAHLAARAVSAAAADAGIDVGDLAYLIGHTTTPDMQLPANIALVADLLGYRGPHVELRQACTGFANALMIAHGLIATGNGPVAIVGSEAGSLFYDPCDVSLSQIVNLVQMGDGAAAIILDHPDRTAARIEASWYGTIGLNQAPSIALRQGCTTFDHDFSNVLERGRRLIAAGFQAAEQGAPGWVQDATLIPHQANGRIGMQLADEFNISEDRFFVHANRIGNTGSAAIWLAFAERRATMRAGERAVALGAEASKYMYGGFAYRHG